MEQLYKSIISGQRAGAVPALLRAVFACISCVYSLIVQARNRCYDWGLLKTTRLNVPVISVGNITTGGTGKTPTVILLVKELQRLGHRPVVLTRGYGAGRNPDGSRAIPDEVAVIQRECLDAAGVPVPVVVNGDRVAGGREAIARYTADVLVLDDGFQHRRLARDLNIVLIDATAPMGIPGVLPRGTWREPPRSLARANLIMLTRCEQVSQELADYAAGLLTEWVQPRDIYQQRTAIVGLFDSAGSPVDTAAANNSSGGGMRGVLAFAGIGNPDGFLHTLRNLGLHVSAACWFDDHHNYVPAADFQALARLTAQRQPVAWVTTLKDQVKLDGYCGPVPLWHVRIAAELAGRQTEQLRERLRSLFSPAAPPAP